MKKTQRSISNVRTIYLVTTLFLTALSFYAYIQIKKLADSSSLLYRSCSINESLQRISGTIFEAESCKRAYILTGDPASIKYRDSLLRTLPAQLNKLQLLIKDNPADLDNLTRLKTAVNIKVMSIRDMPGDTAYVHQSESTIENIEEGREAMLLLQRQVARMEKRETRKFAAQTQMHEDLTFITPIYVIVLFIGAIAILIVSFLKLNVLMAELHHITQETVKQSIELERKKTLQTIIAQAPFSIIVFRGVDFIVESVNKAALHLWGKTLNDVINKPLFDISPELKSAAEPTLSRILQTGEGLADRELQLEFKRNHYIHKGHYDLAIELLDDGDKEHKGLITTLTEVTRQVLAKRKLEESEKRYRELLNKLPVAVYTCDAKGYIELYNDEAVNLWGRTPVIGEEQWCGAPKIYDMGGAELQPAECLLGILQGQQIDTMEIIVERPDGSRRTVIPSPKPLYDISGDIAGAINTLIDITVIKESEFRYRDLAVSLESQVRERTLDLANQNTILQKLNKELELFAHISSHDLQEPLRKVRMAISRIEEKDYEFLSDKGKQLFSRIQDATASMQRLIEDMQTYSRTKNVEPGSELADLDPILEEVILELQTRISEMNATVDTASLGEAYIVPFQFRQLMQNCIGNALKFAKPGVPSRIEIRGAIVPGKKLDFEGVQSNTNYLNISIKDNGIGFEQQYNDRIFEAFQRLHGKDQYEGSGIGLAIVKKIVDNNHGFIRASGVPDEGATFNIYIPTKS